VVQRAVWFCAAVSIVAMCTPARAQDEPEYTATATARRPIPSTNREDTTASGTTIDTRGRPLSLETVSDVMREAPGTRTQQLGGFGSFSGLSLRGAETSHTTVLLGNLPLDTID
jgi:outer membrane cobalamin receptor